MLDAFLMFMRCGPPPRFWPFFILSNTNWCAIHQIKHWIYFPVSLVTCCLRWNILSVFRIIYNDFQLITSVNIRLNLFSQYVLYENLIWILWNIKSASCELQSTPCAKLRIGNEGAQRTNMYELDNEWANYNWRFYTGILLLEYQGELIEWSNSERNKWVCPKLFQLVIKIMVQ